MPCSTACTDASASRAIPTCSRSTRHSPTWSRCSSTSRCPTCCAIRSRRRAATSRARTAWASSRSSSDRRSVSAALCATRSAKPTPSPGSGVVSKPTLATTAGTASRTTAAPSWSLRSSMPFCRSTRGASPISCGSPAKARVYCPKVSLHPDLVNRLTDEAARSARHVLEMCIRALDYCPPVDITFGDYLRAIVTADFEHDPVDDEHRRVAFIEAFRRRGIVPEGVQAFSVDGLLWRHGLSGARRRRDGRGRHRQGVGHRHHIVGTFEGSASALRPHVEAARRVHQYLGQKMANESVVLSGIDPISQFEVHSLRPSIRMDWEGKTFFQWIIELTQRIPQYFDGHGAVATVRPITTSAAAARCWSTHDRQGSLQHQEAARRGRARQRQRRYVLDEANRSLAATYFGGGRCRRSRTLRHVAPVLVQEGIQR